MTIKTKLIEKINSIENEIQLKALLNYLEDSEKEAIKLSEEDLAKIERSNSQIKNGEYLNHQDLKKKFNI